MRELMNEEEFLASDFESMTMENYASQAMDSAIYPSALVYPVLGLTSEAGEVADKVKKIFRDSDWDDTNIDDPLVELSWECREGIAHELGDVLWYVTAIASDLGFELEEIAAMNLEKLASRKHRNQLQGSGDNR